MTYSQLVAEVAKDAGLSREKVGRVLGSFIKITSQALLSGAQVRLRGFGTFYRSEPYVRSVFGTTQVVKAAARFKESRHGQVRRRSGR